jgi:hypothetical protein
MEAVPFNLGLLNTFLLEIIGEKELHQIKNPAIPQLIKLFDADEQYWHVENDLYLWRKSDWLRGLEYREKRKAEHEAFRAKIHQLQNTLDALRVGISKFLHIKNDESCFVTALTILNDRNAPAAKMFGVEGLEDIPKLEKPHLVMEDGGHYYEMR